MPTTKTTTDRVGPLPGGPVDPLDATIRAKAPADSPPASLTLAEPAEVQFRAAAAGDGDDDGTPKLPTFTMVAHTFKPVRLAGWYYPVVVDAEGMSIPSQTRPIRYNHDSDQGVGHTTRIAVENGRLVAEGVISRDTEAARDVVGSSKNGFPWQASIGASVEKYEFIDEKRAVTVNGKEYSGPINVARKTTLNEISFVDLGADDRTRARVAANAPAGGGAGGAADGISGDGEPIDSAEATMQAIRRAKAERERQGAIRALVEEALTERGVNESEIESIAEQALDEKWSVKDTQIAILRATRPRAPQPRRADLPTQAVLEAALCMACGVSDEKLAKDRDFGEAVVSQAYPLRNRGLRGTIAAAMEAMGHRVPHGNREFFDAAREAGRTIQAQVFSTISIPGIVGNVANKILIAAFDEFPATYPLIAQQADFTNFHTHTLYRLDHLGEFEQIGPGGELKHGRLGESDYTNKLTTRGQIIALTREMIINDDLNAFRTLTQQLARKARIAAEKAVYDALMESVDAFYTAGRGNLLTSNALGIGSLGAAEAAMLAMVDADGEPIYAVPRYLLVPPGLKWLADTIFSSDSLNESTTSDSGRPANNPFRGRFQVVSSPYLAAATMDGSSSTTWYLLADPNMLPAVQIAFLDGRRAPTVETADTSFDTLGMQMRCYFDFGVAQLDYRGANKNKA